MKRFLLPLLLLATTFLSFFCDKEIKKEVPKEKMEVIQEKGMGVAAPREGEEAVKKKEAGPDIKKSLPLSAYTILYCRHLGYYVPIFGFWLFMFFLSRLFSTPKPSEIPGRRTFFSNLILSLFLYPLIFTMVSYKVDCYRQKKKITLLESIFRFILVFISGFFITFFVQILLTELIGWFFLKLSGRESQWGGPSVLTVPFVLLYYLIVPFLDILIILYNKLSMALD